MVQVEGTAATAPWPWWHSRQVAIGGSSTSVLVLDREAAWQKRANGSQTCCTLTGSTPY